MGAIVGIITFVFFGALAGWLTARIMHIKTEFWGNALIGIIGAGIGSLALRLIGGVGFTGINLYSLLVSVIGACLFTLAVRQIDNKGTKKR